MDQRSYHIASWGHHGSIMGASWGHRGGIVLASCGALWEHFAMPIVMIINF